MLEHYPLEDICHILAPVGCAFHVFVDLAPFDHIPHIFGVVEQLSKRRTVDNIGLVFQAVEFDAIVQHSLHLGAAAEVRHRLLELFRCLDHDDGELPRSGRDLLHLIQQKGVSRRMDEVGHIVQAISQESDVLSIKGGNERPVQAFDDLVRDGIALVLQVGDSRYLGGDIGIVGKKLG